MREIGKALALITQIGVSMVVPIFLCLILGSFLDKTGYCVKIQYNTKNRRTISHSTVFIK